jgi:hypothetical protein
MCFNDEFWGTGFTGPWSADPENRNCIHFLSNRTHPNEASNVSKENIREDIQEIIYEAINNKRDK